MTSLSRLKAFLCAALVAAVLTPFLLLSLVSSPPEGRPEHDAGSVRSTDLPFPPPSVVGRRRRRAVAAAASTDASALPPAVEADSDRRPPPSDPGGGGGGGGGEGSSFSLGELLSSPDGVLYGDPTSHSQCRNALLDAHGLDVDDLVRSFRAKYDDVDIAVVVDKGVVGGGGKGDDDARGGIPLTPVNAMMDLTNSRRRRWAKKPKNLPPSFWSRESLSATTSPAGNDTLDVRCSILSNFDPWREDDDDDDEKKAEGVATNATTDDDDVRAAYVVLGKCGSSSISAALDRRFSNFRRYPGVVATRHGVGHPTRRRRRRRRKGDPPPKMDDRRSLRSVDCAFTFVRDPLHRLVSGYYTIHFFLWRFRSLRLQASSAPGASSAASSSHPQYPFVKDHYKFWSVTSDPQERFKSFVRELIERPNSFVIPEPMEHVTTMTGNMSPWFGSNLTFVGKIEKFEEHWRSLSNYGRCRDVFGTPENQRPIDKDFSFEWVYRDAKSKYRPPPDQVKALGLDDRYDDNNVDEDKTKKNRTKYDLPPWRAIASDQGLFDSIIEHYWQDYVCFGYDPAYPQIGMRYRGKFWKPY